MYVTGIGIFSLIISASALIITIITTSYLIVKLNQLKQQLEDALGDIQPAEEDNVTKETTSLERSHHDDRHPIKRGPAPSSMADARIEWMDQVTLYTEELITHSAALLQASKRIIESNLEIKNSVATTATHKMITKNVTIYNTNADEFKIVLAKLRLTFYDDRKNADALAALKKIERIVNSEYETQIHSDISRHDFLVAEYEKHIEQFVGLTRKQLEEEWEKIKRGR